ncbi:hypothetical protein IFM89_021668 [Coptis chinensis]|uniref:RRM domain-containing protein n=1 Tax=Coptis chinensis TaxID=261450 RepID=A0A835M3J4_9MAGN|nr:hypothetical protein IFM89_021668 [Coptis chinensis]
MTYPPPPGVVVVETTMQQHPPYDPNYLLYQQQQQQHHHPYYNEQQNINTLFVSGIPDDIKPREIHNLFRRRLGFDFCQLKYTGRGNQVVAFATFFDHQSAMAAVNTLNGAVFDPRTGAVLHIELARSNSRPKRLRGAGAYYVIDKRTKVSDDAQQTSSSDGDDGSDEPSGTNNPNSSNKGEISTAESADKAVDHGNAGVTENEQSEKAVAGNLPPCSTLFIANLGPNCTEEELKGALSHACKLNNYDVLNLGELVFPGVNCIFILAEYTTEQNKLHRDQNNLLNNLYAVISLPRSSWQEVDQATEAMNGLQDSLLPSSDRGGMHLDKGGASCETVTHMLWKEEGCGYCIDGVNAVEVWRRQVTIAVDSRFNRRLKLSGGIVGFSLVIKLTAVCGLVLPFPGIFSNFSTFTNSSSNRSSSNRT